jgi:8-oxo-dGTP pyrophosphatase MutT (NUDIX family)
MSREEVVTIVDENNRPVGAAPRWKMRAERLVHRAAYILVFDSSDRLFLQKRTPTKDVYPGCYDVAAGGVVLQEESYEQSARRELAEELGISNVEIRRHFDFYYADEHSRLWGRVYSCRFDGPMVLQPEEIESGAFRDIAEVLDMSTREPFTPDGLAVLKRVLKETGRNPQSDR